MKLAILGYSGQGQSSYNYWNNPENEITICDSRTDISLPADVHQQLGENYLQGLSDFDLIIRGAPSIHPRDIVAANSEAILSMVTTNTNEFFRVCPSKNIIGVTGTKGKGTTSTLITKMLEAAGKKVHLGGNIGIPPLDLLKDTILPEDWVVLELANFQTIDLKYSPPLAVCLMVAPEHLDWHGTMQEYIEAKQQLFRWQTPDDSVVYYANNENSKTVVSVSSGRKIPYMSQPGAIVTGTQISIAGENICVTSELKLLGTHNWQNVCAALTLVWQITQDSTALRNVLTTFSGLPFRIEFRREVAGVAYYNDSFASAPPATLAAIEAIPIKKVVIMGGFERGLPLDELATGLKASENTIRTILLIGASAERTAAALADHGFTNYSISTNKDMPSIVGEATSLASPGDAVVLSPGFASFDMFKNFEDRGLKFNAAVEAL